MGVSSRFNLPTPSGHPVLWSADAITGHADALRRKPAPEHLVAGADRHDSVILSIAKQPHQPPPNAEIEFVDEQVMMHRHFSSKHLAQRATLLQASDFWREVCPIQTAHQID
jgi:hypothetical protein